MEVSCISLRIFHRLEAGACRVARRCLSSPVLIILLIGLARSSIWAQSTTSIEGQVVDEFGGSIGGAEVRVGNSNTGIDRSTTTDGSGRYTFAALPVGLYMLEVRASGFKTRLMEEVRLQVAQPTILNFQLQVGDISQSVTVLSDQTLVEHSSISVGHIVDQRAIQETPLNGRYFLDLGLLVPGSVTASQTGFSSYPSRGVGALAINTAGNREETVNYMINGITLNNLVFESITFQPSIDAIEEFKIDNSTFSAQYGQTSGAVVNIATRSGSNGFHGGVFEYLRNDRFDARNSFTLKSSEPPPFKRNQFGGHIGGPVLKDKLFFFFSYEGLRQRQGLDLNSLVLSDEQRASATDPVIVRLLPLIPRANFFDLAGTPRFVGSATAPVDVDQWSADVNYNLSQKDILHGFYAIHDTFVREPNRFGNTIPGFGHDLNVLRQILTINESHVLSSTKVNELRLGFNRSHSGSTPVAQFNPADFGINNGRGTPVGLPQINIAGGALNFGGPSQFPSGRRDLTYVAGDTLSIFKGPHLLKIGAEFRQFYTDSFRLGTGSFNFPSVAAFIADTANSFSITLGNQTARITERALNAFVQDGYKLRPNLTLELGLRYDWNMTPTEKDDRFIVFDPQTVSLVRVGQQIDNVYHENNKNLQPRVGFSWDPFNDGRTSVRAAYAILVDQPMTSVVTATSANPPLSIPLTFSGPIRLDNALMVAQAAGLSPQTVDHGFDNAYLQSWNLNIQREIAAGITVSVGYYGSKGTHLIIRRNLNQPVEGVRPYLSLSPSSPILPGSTLGNIIQAESAGNSSYNAMWITGTQRLRRGLQLSASYTWSRSLDYNSLSSQGVVVQDSNDLGGDRGLSDFDARHRFVVRAIYDLPFKGNAFVNGWQLAAIVQSQSGSPVNIVTLNSTINGVPLTVRPDVNGPIVYPHQVNSWFDTSAFTAVPRFGSLGRNVVIGPTFNNTDIALMKNVNVGDLGRLQLRVEFFDLFNHANLGQPGNVVGAPTFGQITNTRFPTGESGSSREIQVAARFNF